MSKIKLITAAVAAIAFLTSTAAQAAVTYTNWSSGTLNTAIADGNPAGITKQVEFSGGLADDIVNVNVTLNISGGFNGDLYGYLVLQSDDSSTTTAFLLNRVGRTGAADFGFSTAGFSSVVLSGDTSQGYLNIHDVAIPGAGPYLADGRTTNPLGDFTGSTSTQGLDTLAGNEANGTWTLFLADLSGGAESTLVSWGLEISVVPEPVTWALIFFGTLMGGMMTFRLVARSGVSTREHAQEIPLVAEQLQKEESGSI